MNDLTRILCVEDEPDLLNDLLLELGDMGYFTVAELDGPGALESLQRPVLTWLSATSSCRA